MNLLFRIETDRVFLTLNSSREDPELPYSSQHLASGQLRIIPKRHDISFSINTWRASVPDLVKSDWKQTVGPRLFEERNYLFYIRSKRGEAISFTNLDPTLVRASEERDSSSIHGIVNFGSQVGLSLFSVVLDKVPELDFEVEVFPTKIDYASDYEQLTAEIQDVCTGLALEYLRSTYKVGVGSQEPRPSSLEWTLLLKHALGKLEKSIEYIGQHPHRNIVRELDMVRADRLKRTDAFVRRAISRGAGTGKFIREGLAFPYRERISERTPRWTLDTPEHRWLAHQLKAIRRRLSQIRSQHLALLNQKRRFDSRAEREARTLDEISRLEQGVARLAQAGPLSTVTPTPPPNFASMTLLGAPGYREAYQSIVMLLLGLRLAGGPIRVSVKELSTLYEYWCYITVLRIVASLVKADLPPHLLIRPEQHGLKVTLQKGQETRICFDLTNGRKIWVTYNPQFRGEQAFLVPQQPDILLTIEDPSWPALHIVLDAKYRLDNSRDALARYQSPGPPQDALNVLHRYRDAIVETAGGVDKPKRTIVEAAALFPYRELDPGSFRNSRLWRSLDRIGVGAIPMLPNGTDYFAEYLTRILKKGGWSLADLALGHRSVDRAVDWREAASRPVLVAVLRSGIEAQHLSWIQQKQIYYMPLLRTQRRQYQVSSVMIFSPAALRTPGAITHIAKVEVVEILKRKEIDTPWKSGRDPDQMISVYKLGALQQLAIPIPFKPGTSFGLRGHRWTSELGARRASNMSELFLETAPEWRLYEALRISAIDFEIKADSPTLEDSDDPQGRAWFKLDTFSVQYRGAAGFLIRRSGLPDRYQPTVESVLMVLKDRI